MSTLTLPLVFKAGMLYVKGDKKSQERFLRHGILVKASSCLCPFQRTKEVTCLLGKQLIQEVVKTFFSNLKVSLDFRDGSISLSQGR